jgi:hypothetical protein
VPQAFRADRKGWISDVDSHPTRWMNDRLALGYLARLAAMGVIAMPPLEAEQQAVVDEWERFNASVPSAEQVDAHVSNVMGQVPEAYTSDGDFGRVAAGVDQTGTMGRRGLVYLRARRAAPEVVMELEVGPYAARFAREVTLSVRSFERQESTATKRFSAAPQRVVIRVPAPAAGRYPVYEIMWRFNYDECPDPTRCASARLVSVRGE